MEALLLLLGALLLTVIAFGLWWRGRRGYQGEQARGGDDAQRR
jgi:hypothetical protein